MVNISRAELKSEKKLAGELGLEIDEVYPNRDLFPLEDTPGIMVHALSMFKRTHMPGRVP